MKSIGDKISEARKAKGLTQDRLGALLGISGQAVSKWENGFSVPDILILADLCDVLDISVDELLGISAEQRGKNFMRDFSRHARETGRNAVLLDAMSRTYNDVGSPQDVLSVNVGAGGARVYDPRGIGFVSTSDAQKALLEADAEDIAYFLRILTDTTCLRVLAEISINEAKTEVELCKAVDIDEETMDRILLGFMKRGIVCCDRDPAGKYGYLQSVNMVGVVMALAGCAAVNYGGEIAGMGCFSR